jgi:hypothetical protein
MNNFCSKKLELPTFFPMPYALLVWKIVLEKFLKGILYFSFIVRWTLIHLDYLRIIYILPCRTLPLSSFSIAARILPPLADLLQLKVLFSRKDLLLELLLPLGFLLLPCLCCVILPQHPTSIVCICQLPTLATKSKWIFFFSSLVSFSLVYE